MIIVNQPRQAGKTTKLVEMAIEHRYDILVFNNAEKERLLRTFEKLEQDQVFTWSELPKRKANKRYYGTVVDNLDFILSQHIPNRVRAISLNAEVAE